MYWGSYFFPQRITGESYRYFLQEEIPDILEETPLQLTQHFWAPAHFTINIRHHLNTV